jgi:L-aspartate oxidase
VLGSGIAGLTFALRCSEWADVVIVTKKDRSESNTNYAQGGIASVLSSDDNFKLHMKDTLEAGDGLCHPDVVETVVTQGPPLVRRLMDLGVEFSRSQTGDLALGREGGHSRRRIVHAKDQTGREIERALLAAVAARPNIRMFEDHVAIDLLVESRLLGLGVAPAGQETCWGAYVLDARTGEIRPFVAAVTCLATGGCGKVYRFTTNPDIATGDGLAMAYRAGATVGNLEFVQFHPTCLFHPEARSFLISEAVRGEGALLKTLDGQPFMSRYHPLADLAPRDIVARSIDMEMKTRGESHVLLDATHLGETRLVARFPHIVETCRRFGIDPARTPIPVVPAAHYMCGGVATDIDTATDVVRLLAIGEVALTGLHGANRLASNSLLEALVFGERASVTARGLFAGARVPRPAPWVAPTGSERKEKVIVDHNWASVRGVMWDYVGIVRSDERLASALERVTLIRNEVERFYRRFTVDTDLIELRNITLISDLIIRCAQARRESRGLHYNQNCPERDDEHFRRDTLIPAGRAVFFGPPIGTGDPVTRTPARSESSSGDQDLKQAL